VTRKIRDLVVSGVTILVLCVILMAINPQLRERVTGLASDREFSGVRSAVSFAVSSTVGLVQGYAGDNTYLFTFFIAACVFVVLMLKVIA